MVSRIVAEEINSEYRTKHERMEYGAD